MSCDCTTAGIGKCLQQLHIWTRFVLCGLNTGLFEPDQLVEVIRERAYANYRIQSGYPTLDVFRTVTR